MIREIKSQAKKILISNYKLLIIPVFLFMLSKFIVSIILNYFTSWLVFNNLTEAEFIYTLFLVMSFELVIIPVLYATIYKSIHLIYNKTAYFKADLKSFLNFSNILKIILMNLIPSLMTTLSAICSSKFSILNLLQIDGIPLILLLICAGVINYMFFACNYFFVVTEASIKASIIMSFKTMKKIFFEWLALVLSFMHLAFLQGIIGVICKIIFGGSLNAYTPILDSFSTFGFGIGFYIIPYFYLTAFIFFRKYKS